MAKFRRTEKIARQRGWRRIEERIQRPKRRDRNIGGDRDTLTVIGDIGRLTQEDLTGDTTTVDAHNGFNDLIHLEMLWTVRHQWPEGVWFNFNCYKNWAQLLLRQLGKEPIIILSKEGVTQNDPLYMVLYGITLASQWRRSGRWNRRYWRPFTLMAPLLMAQRSRACG